MCNFAPMKVDFLYSDDFYGMNSKELSHTCLHLLCTSGEGSFVFNEHCYHIAKNDLVPKRINNISSGKSCASIFSISHFV